MDKAITVLSLFDGISCGQVALKRAGIKVKKYYASEIDKCAIKVAQQNYPNTIQLGDVTKIKDEMFSDGIDLLIGGSPCQGFSFAGKQLSFDDQRSKLFFEYVRILKELRPRYFLLENVKMKKETQAVISKYLRCEPIEINSSLVSAQNRKRLYWTNIEGVTQPEDKFIMLQDALDLAYTKREKVDRKRILKTWITKNYLQYDLTGKGHKSQDQRAYYFNSKHGALPSSGCASKVKVLLANGDIVKLTVNDCERLQTLPDAYTMGVSRTKRYAMIGNGWTVDVIAHILKNIKNQKNT